MKDLHDTARPWERPLLRSPFHPRMEALNRHSSWAPWSGWLSALDYGDTEMEVSAIRNTATLYDLSPMVKYRVAGPGAEAMLDRLTLRNVAKLKPGRVQYTGWCDDDGKLLDDGTLFRLGPEEFRLCCQERHLPWLLDSAIGFDVAVEEVTEEIAALSLQGPCSASVLRAAGFDIEALKPFQHDTQGGILISRTGFTGDLGYELWTGADAALPLWDRLMEAGAPWHLRPVGSTALDIARIEAGFIVAGTDFIPAEQALREDRVLSPLELGLGWMIDWEKGHFTGRRALAAEREGNTSRWALVGLEVEGNVAAEGAIVYRGKRREVGTVTSAIWSPTTKQSLALALVEAKHAASPDLWVEIYAMRELRYAKLMQRARPAPRPFFSPARRRATPPGAV
ncbi:aminomethyltransferase family protein [Pseudoroseicyclus tamaricis]|uniref:Aminomethyl transferase family protein n=1 Tax=Pseudoroseicyclus tamaricis TaxID=2705421 RepID=A0A6B2JGE4_9RHOB|nr:aminomethyltransferase family protein [Pseudoroseicyclus tamaricis]NDV00223.1 aminomethyl transferase family protein [Pseudoroseicyclus tamaricis]